MAFTTPCFVRVEDAAERKKLIEWCNDVIRGSGEEQPPKSGAEALAGGLREGGEQIRHSSDL